jgi:hypothetical protein
MSTRALLVLLVSARAYAAPTYVPLTDLPTFQARLSKLETWVHDYARHERGPSPLAEPAKFCGAFSDWDMQGTITAMWDELSPGPRSQLLPHLAGLVVRCGCSQGAAKRAGFIIDYMYWNQLADTTGYEVADALTVRDIFHEIYTNQLAQDLIKQNTAALAHKAEPAKDFLTAPPMVHIGLARKAAAVLDAFSADDRHSFNAMTEVVNFREGYLTPFGNDLMRILESPSDRTVLKQFYSYLQYAVRTPKLLGERHGGWHELMRITSDNSEQATRVLGVMASLLYMPLEDLAPALASRGQLGGEIIEALHEGSMAYYLINQLDERAARTATDDDHSLVYHFFYPDDYQTKNWKWYHWFNNAHLGCSVARRGYAKDAVTSAARLLGAFYEAATLNLVIPARHTIGLEPRVAPILEGYQDVRINEEGAAFGAAACSTGPPR